MPKRRSTRLVALLAMALVVFPYVCSRLASPWRRVSLHSLPDPTVGNRSESTFSGPLRIACYNIAHGRGTATSNWAGGSAASKMERLDQIAQLLRRIDADMVVLNEVDFDCSWSHGVNQAAYLAEKAGYPHWAQQRNVDFRVLMWTWKFGNAVLSKYPIHDAQPIDFPAYSSLESLLGGQKRGLICEISVGAQQRFDLFAVHLSHRSETVRVASVNQMADRMRDRRRPAILAGDFNSTPSNFPQSATDAAGENAIEQLLQRAPLQRLPDRVPLQPAGFTFHATEPNRVIDWIFVPESWTVADYRVELSMLSDHRPVVADVKVSEPSVTSSE